MKSFRDRNPYVVGIITVLIIGATVGAALMVGVLHLLDDTYSMSGEFVDASNVGNGDQVKIAGVDVGRVTGVEPNRENGTVIITWEVNAGVQLGPDTTAEIALATLLGTKYLRLEGPVEAPYMEDVEEEDRHIPLDRTIVPFEVADVLTSSTRSIEATNTEDLNSFINDLADITEGKQATVRDLVVGLDRVTRAINERDTEVDQLLQRADTLSNTLAEKDETLVRLIDTSQAVLDLIVERRDDLARALGEGSEVVAELSRLVSVHQAELDGILDVLHPTFDLIERQQDDLDTTLAWLGPGSYLQSLGGTHGPWLDNFVASFGPVDALRVLREFYPTLPGFGVDAPPVTVPAP